MYKICIAACLLFLIVCCELYDYPYDGPLWGDKCEVVRDDPQVLHACWHWTPEYYLIGVCQENSPGSTDGACRPFCRGGVCEAGDPTIHETGFCYCAER